jgi:pyrroline-5-carboxylate reductase
VIGLAGAGNMAGALAEGWGDPVLATDSGSGRAQRLVDRLGGERVDTLEELAERSEHVVLGFKPYMLDDLAPKLQAARSVISLLGGVRLEQLRAAFPEAASVVVAIPNTPVAVQRGVTAIEEGSDDLAAMRALFARVGSVMVLPARLMAAATGTAGVGPAYVALFAEAWIDAAVRAGLKPEQATALVLDGIVGSAELLLARDGDTLAVRRGVTSPGGTTARGLRALEAAGLRGALQDAMDATL